MSIATDETYQPSSFNAYRVSQFNDAKLNDIVDNPDRYTERTVEYAEQELDRRDADRNDPANQAAESQAEIDSEKGSFDLYGLFSISA